MVSSEVTELQIVIEYLIKVGTSAWGESDIDVGEWAENVECKMR